MLTLIFLPSRHPPLVRHRLQSLVSLSSFRSPMVSSSSIDRLSWRVMDLPPCPRPQPLVRHPVDTRSKSVPSWLWDHARACTSTLHVRPLAWCLLLVLELLTMFAALFLGYYCADDERCPSKGYWPEDVWGLGGPNTCGGWLCERCSIENLIHSPITTLSNVSFVLVGWIILVFGFEDIFYFSLSKSSDEDEAAPVHPMQDYVRSSPPSLILAGSGWMHVLIVVPGSLALHYAGVGSFLYHASFTPLSSTLDLGSVWTLTTVILPYCFLNHLYCVKDIPYYGPRIIVFLTFFGMVASFVLPIYCTEGVDAYAIVPITAGLNFVSQVSYNSVCATRVRPRSWGDVGHLAVALTFMLTAYHLQLHDTSTYCFSPSSPFQAHAAWHCGMAGGVCFFYFFLRQERQRPRPQRGGGGGGGGRLDEGEGSERNKRTGDDHHGGGGGTKRRSGSGSSSEGERELMVLGKEPEAMV